MKSRIYKSVLSIGLSIILSLAPLSLSAATSGGAGSAVGGIDNAKIKSKEEVIFAALKSDGSVRSVYAVNHFTAAEAGSFTDYGEYTTVTNLTDTTPIAQYGDAVTFQINADNFYYQGNMATSELPWIFEISYSLDGASIAPQELGGKSGELQIHILTRQNTAIDATFYDNYMLQISITLDSEKCSDIKAPGATVAGAGKNKVIAYTVMPGMDADISLSATVRDFTMTGIDISALPFSIDIELPNTESLIDDFTELSDAISDLKDGVGKLAYGLAELKTGAGILKNGSADIKNGLSELSGSSGQLLQASSQISAALTQISSSLNESSGEMNLGNLIELPQSLSQLAGGLEGVSGALSELGSGFSPAYAALDGAIEGIPDATISQEQITTLYIQTDPSQHTLLDQLIASYTSGQTVKGTYKQVKSAFDAVASTTDTLSTSINTISAALDDMSVKINSALSSMDMTRQLAQLSAGLTELDENYTAFHNGLSDYMSGVGKLSSGYAGFHSGLSSYCNGISELYDGVVRLHNGTVKLSDETAKIPDTIQSELNDMLDEYTGSDFEPISFTSRKNGHTELVQFVLKCDGVEKPEETKSTDFEAGSETFWDRLVALFTGKKE